MTPRRPALAGHVRVRRHSTAGEAKVVLHDARTGGVSVIGEREWTLLRAADGTRDLDGILAWAAREGVRARPEALREFLDGLAGAGLLVEGTAEGEDPASGSDEAEPDVPAERLLEPLAGFSLVCDGSGSCCRLYSTVVFTAADTARARALLPERLDAGSWPEHAFSPERGSVARGVFAVAQRDGRCLYLEDDGACGLHARGGASAKPVGCGRFPASFVDDGETVRVAPMVECACVLASAGRLDGSALVGPGVRTRGDLPEGTFLARVPERVLVTAGVEWPRARFVAWGREASARAEGGPGDALVRAWLLACELDGSPAAPPTPGDFRGWLVALGTKAADRAIADASWRGDRDLARRSARWIALAAVALAADDDLMARALEGPVDPRGEALYLRAVLHGHQLVRSGVALALALRDRAVRLLVARAMPAVMDVDEDSACKHPLALVEAMLRSHGLSAYVDDVGA